MRQETIAQFAIIATFTLNPDRQLDVSIDCVSPLTDAEVDALYRRFAAEREERLGMKPRRGRPRR